MLRQDLAAAKIEYRTDAGYFDFHAARHTGITRGSAIMRSISSSRSPATPRWRRR